MKCIMISIFNEVQQNGKYALIFGFIPWKREWLPTPGFLPEKSHGQSSVESYSPWGHRVGHSRVTNTHFFLKAGSVLNPLH